MSRSDQDERARNRARYPLIYGALQEMREVFGEDVKLICGVSIDGATVGREPYPGWFEQWRKKLESW